MKSAAKRFPVLAWSLSGFGALRDTIIYVPVWIVVFIAISVVYTVFYKMVAEWHAGQILIYLQHYLVFDFSNLSDANSLDYVLQLKDIFELALPIVLAYLTVIPIAVARSQLSGKRDATAHIGFGQAELIVALNTLSSYLPLILFLIFLAVVDHNLANFIAPQPMVADSGGLHTALAADPRTHGIHKGFQIVTMVLAVPLLVFTYVRTSLSLPYSVEQNRLGVLFSWRATRGMFWAIFKVEVLAALWAVIVCALVYGLFVAGYTFLFEKVYTIHYSIVFTGDMDAQWFFNLVAVSTIYILFLILTFGPIVTIYRAVAPDESDAEGDDTVD